MLKTQATFQANGNERFFTTVPDPHPPYTTLIFGGKGGDLNEAFSKMSVISIHTGMGLCFPVGHLVLHVDDAADGAGRVAHDRF